MLHALHAQQPKCSFVKINTAVEPNQIESKTPPAIGNNTLEIQEPQKLAQIDYLYSFEILAPKIEILDIYIFIDKFHLYYPSLPLTIRISRYKNNFRT